ncbi:MAG: hypothetical protein KatS3mg113_0664 [Planctomycetaceae bacterium]|nr:MAG: hypothetical protein KatS3mg113_0664 [Planctomycetaceae bacterium]
MPALDVGEVLNNLRVIELTQKTRQAAIRALVQAGNWDEEGIPPDKVLQAIEEREAVAQTLMAPDFAMPHAFIDWEGDYRIILGRSRTGVDYGVPSGQQVKLIVLLVIGRKLEQNHVELLASLAELLKSADFRQQLIEAKDLKTLETLLAEKAGASAGPRAGRASIPRLTQTLIRQAIQLVRDVDAQALLIAIDKLEHIPWDMLEGWTGKLLIITSKHSDEVSISRHETHVFDVLHEGLSRMDRAHLGLLLASSQDLLVEKQSVVCVTGADGRKLDSITIARPQPFFRKILSEKNSRGIDVVRPAVMLRVLSLALEISAEGREAHPVGTMFILGDARNVLRHSQQLVLNPFYGYSHKMRNVLDPSLSETIKEYALIDGAFVIRGDGIVLTAGTYLMPRGQASPHLPSGLGTRHQTASAITAHTQAMAITVSQSSGAVSVFRNGNIVLTLERTGGSRW